MTRTTWIGVGDASHMFPIDGFPAMPRWMLQTAVVGLCLSATSITLADEVNRHMGADEERSQSWYNQQPAYQPDTRAIIHQKAQVRAQQRQARMASMSWYGMTNSRPTAAPTPFTSLYSPVWQRPGGRPFAWHACSRPSYVFYTR